MTRHRKAALVHCGRSAHGPQRLRVPMWILSRVNAQFKDQLEQPAKEKIAKLKANQK
jgi:hypothetical protein